MAFTFTLSHLRAATDTQKILHQVEGEDWPSLQHLFNQSGKRYQDLTLTRGPTLQGIEAHADDLAPKENKRPRLSLLPNGYHDDDVSMDPPVMTWLPSVDTSVTPMMQTGPAVHQEPASSSTGNPYSTEPQADTEEQIPTQTFDMSTPPITPRNAHSRTDDTTEEAGSGRHGCRRRH